MEIKLGSLVEDSLTGYRGYVVARTEYLYGCIRCSVLPAELKDGMPQRELGMDEPQLIVINEDKVMKEEDKPLIPRHGTRPDPVRPDLSSR